MRPPDFVMSAARAAAVVPNALSFPRATMRELVRDRYRIDKLRFELDARGRGEILYRLSGGGATFHFFLVSQELPEEQKTDRNFAPSWDAMGVLCEGEWSAGREAHLRREVPRQRAGYADYDTLIYARGNRSKRVFDHVVDSLADGRQPDLALVAPIGYILRTTAFIGNGALGTRPWAGLPPGHPLRRPYHVQFCSAFALREFVFDLVDHMARARSPRSVRLAPAYRRYLGLGNSAATGLAAFVANHPHFMHRWTLACEQALAQASSRAVDADTKERFVRLLDRAIRYHAEGAHDSDGVFVTPQAVAADLARLRQALPLTSWRAMHQWAHDNLCGEAREVASAIVLELYPDIADRFAAAFEADERCEIAPAMRVAQMRAVLQEAYGWALALPDDMAHYFWYRSTAAPRDVRRGVRGRALDLEAETTMDTVLQVRSLAAALQNADAQSSVANLVHRHPELRHIVGRAQALAQCEYGELRQQMLARDYSPFATIRYPLSFFGMEKFEAARPKSVRGVFMQGAPIAEDVAAGRDGAWPFPLLPGHDDDSSLLAPLPDAATSYRAPSLPAFDAAAPLRIAPGELARMVQAALQGHGMPLGVAADAAPLVAFAHARGEPGIAAHLRDCARQGAYDTAFDSREVDAQCVLLDAAGRSVLACAPSAFDFAVACATQRGFGVALAAPARDGWLAEALALRAANDGFIAFVLWRADGGERCGFAASGPAARGAWFASGRTLRQDAFGADDGFLVACARREGDVSTSAVLEALVSSRRAEVVWDEDAVRDRQESWVRQGLAIARADFDALALAGRALLVPQAEEARVLDPGVDPLRTF